MNVRSHRAPLRRRDEARDLFRNGILEAAEQVFVERGLHAARIQDIARRAGVGVGTVYNHFEHKDDVLAALMDERLAEMLASVDIQPTDPRGFRARLENRIARLCAVVEQHRGFCALILGRDVPRRRRDRLGEAWLRIVDEGLAAGALRALDRVQLALFLGAVVRTLISSAVLSDHEPIAERAQLAVRLFLEGAGGRPS